MKQAIILLLIISSSMAACKKQLEAKPDKKLATLSTLPDLQALLDNTPATYVEPSAEEASADNYYLTEASYNGLYQSTDRAIYGWAPANQFSGISSDWGTAYKKVYYCNSVLDALTVIPRTDPAAWNNIKGQALVARAKTFWHIADIWALAYDETTAASEPGIPLRLNSNFNEKSVRASIKDTYSRIILDLQEAIPMLPVVPLNVIRPSRPAAYAMLSRVFLSMRQYKNAKLYADSALILFPNLMDYNLVSNDPVYPFSNPNPESIYVTISGSSLLIPSRAIVDSILYNSYEVNDLRKTLFFKSLGANLYSFRGSYANYYNHFSGLASDELYLTRAECLVRSGQVTEGLQDLNDLLIKRYKSGTFVPVTATTVEEALPIVLRERRKELIFRFTRWMDIKRLNKEGAAIKLERIIGGLPVMLPPNDPRYALAIPEDVIALSGMEQNPR
jgi:hypothetical protein